MPIALVLCDLELTGSDGWSVQAKLSQAYSQKNLKRSDYSEAKLIMPTFTICTNNVIETSAKLKAFEAGIDFVMRKPIVAKRILKLLDVCGIFNA